MKNFFVSLGIITVLFFFPVSETLAYDCSQIAFEGNYVWCSTDSGLVKMNKLVGSYQIFSSVGWGAVVDYDNVKWLKAHDNNGVVSFDDIAFKYYTTEKGLVNNKVNQIAVDLNNVKWFATPSGVSSFDGTEWKTFTTEDGLVNNDVLAVAVDHNNVKWFGTRWGGVSSYNDTTWTTHQLTFNDITYNHISSIAVNNENVVWFGCNRAYDYSGKSCGFEQVLISIEGTSLTLHENTSLRISEYTNFPAWVQDIACGPDDAIWYIYYGYMGNELYTYNQISGDVTFFSGKKCYCGIWSVRAVSVDNEGIAWLATGDGLRSFDGETCTPYTFDFSNNFSNTNVEAPETPLPFSIRGAYPNPFNASTTISFTLPASGFTQLVIYNITGQKVRELVAETMTVGIHNVMWDGRDESGTVVSSGVYMSLLETIGFRESRKMLFLK